MLLSINAGQPVELSPERLSRCRMSRNADSIRVRSWLTARVARSFKASQVIRYPERTKKTGTPIHPDSLSFVIGGFALWIVAGRWECTTKIAIALIPRTPVSAGFKTEGEGLEPPSGCPRQFSRLVQ